jgi:hypothetical protein
MSAETKNASSILDCAECVKSGFFWSSSSNDNNSCIPYRNNTMDINQIDQCPIPSTLVNTASLVPTSELRELIGNVEDSSNIEEYQLNMVNSIKILQEIESKNYSTLSTGIANDTLTNEDQRALMKNIAEVSALRIDLYRNLLYSINVYSNTLKMTSNTVKEQLVAIDIVEKELEYSAAKMKQLNDDNNAKIRMTEINRYYKDKYADHAIFMKYLIFFSVLLLIVYAIYKKYYITPTVYYLLIIVIVFFMIIKMVPQFYRMIFRSNMDYQEYEFPIGDLMTGSVNSAASSSGVNINNPWLNQELEALSKCVGGIADASLTNTTNV